MKDDVPSCRYCVTGWIFYAVDPEGAIIPLRRPIACDCAGGRIRQTAGAASWKQLFYRKHWQRIDNHKGNRIDNERRRDALQEELGVKPLIFDIDLPNPQEPEEPVPF